jgi:hypothetical protein
MCKKLLSLILVLSLASVAMSGDITLNRDVPKTSAAPSINGTISAGEWSDALAIPFDYTTVMANGGAFHNGGGQSTPVPTSDYDATYYMKWDSSKLYIAVDVTDNYYFEDSDWTDGMNNGDCAQLGFTLGTPSSGGAIIWDFGASTGGGGIARIHEHDPWGHGGYGITAASSIAGSVGGGGYIIEVALAWADLSYTPALNDQHLMYLISPDFDNGTGGDGTSHHTMSIGEGTWFGEYSPDHPEMNTMTLTPEPATILMLGLGGLALLRRKR